MVSESYFVHSLKITFVDTAVLNLRKLGVAEGDQLKYEVQDFTLSTYFFVESEKGLNLSNMEDSGNTTRAFGGVDEHR